ncbi:hypothetical protein M569_13445, partial [Genlisea aurea]
VLQVVQVDEIEGGDKRSKKSNVWSDFTESIDPNDSEVKNQCLHCNKLFKKSKGAPTSTLRRHIASCKVFNMKKK